MKQLTQQDIANIINNGKTGKIKQIEAGVTQSISYDDAKKIEEKYNISEQWLRFGKGKILKEKDELKEINDYEKNLLLDNNLVILPYYENIKASAGNGYINYDDKKAYIKIPFELVPVSNKELEIIKVDGDSMEETISSGDFIFVNKKCIDAINGKIYLVRYEDELYIKRYFNINNEIILKSDNKFYPDIKPKPNEHLELCGKVVGRLNRKDLA